MTPESFTDQDASDTARKLQDHLGELKPKLLPPPRPETGQVLRKVEQHFLETHFLNEFFQELHQNSTVEETAQIMVIKFKDWRSYVIGDNPISEAITLESVGQTALNTYLQLLEVNPQGAKQWARKLSVINLAASIALG